MADTREITDTPQDAPKDYTNKEIHDVSLEDIFDEVAEQEEDKKVAPATPETPTTPEPETPPVETKPAEPITPPIDADKLKEEISDSVAKKLIDQLAPADATTEEKKDLLAEAPWTKENREPTWEEALKYMADQNKDTVKQEILKELNDEVLAEEKREEEAAKTAAEQERIQTESWNKEWDRQLDALTTSGKIPRVLNPLDPNDPGVKERTALFTRMAEIAEENRKAGKPVSLSLIETHALHYTPPTATPPGADAPVSGAQRAVATTPSTEFSYGEIHNQSLEDLYRQG